MIPVADIPMLCSMSKLKSDQMDSYRKMVNTALVAENHELKDIVRRLQDMKDKVSHHAQNNKDASVIKTLDDGILIGRLEDAIRLLAPEVFKAHIF